MENLKIPAISLDLNKSRIRIHKQTLRLLEKPNYIQILVNPDKKTIAIKKCQKEAEQSHHIIYKEQTDCEFYSKELLQRISTVNSELNEGTTYRAHGQIFSKEKLAVFYMQDFVPVNIIAD